MRPTTLGATALAVLLATTIGAQAADLGGNCCADLEERVAELEATTARKGNRRMSVEVYGQVNAAILYHDRDDVIAKQSKVIDNSVSSTRFGFRGKGKINAEYAAGFRMEFDANVETGGSPTVRHAYVWIQSKALGRASIGQQSQATDGVMEIDLSRSSVVSLNASLAPFDSFVKGQTTLGVINPFDGGRKQSVKWASPVMAGFAVSASWSDDDTYDVALRYAGEFGGLAVAAGVGYRDDGIRTFHGGSASAKHLKTGLFLNGFWGRSDGIQQAEFMGIVFPVGDAELTTYGGRAGVENKVAAGILATFFGEYAKLEIAGVDLDASMVGGGLNFHIEAAAMDVYIGVRQYKIGDEDVTVGIAGSRIQF